MYITFVASIFPRPSDQPYSQAEIDQPRSRAEIDQPRSQVEIDQPHSQAWVAAIGGYQAMVWEQG